VICSFNLTYIWRGFVGKFNLIKDVFFKSEGWKSLMVVILLSSKTKMRELTLRHVSRLYFKKEVKERIHTNAANQVASLLRSRRTGCSQFEGRTLEGMELASKIDSIYQRYIVQRYIVSYACKSVDEFIVISQLSFMRRI